MPAPLTIRHAVIADAAEIARLANELNAHEGEPPTAFNEAVVRRHGFGPKAAFEAIVAQMGKRLVGYVMFHRTFNSDRAVLGYWLVDLYVEAAARRHGIGRALLAAVATHALEQGGQSLWWSVRSTNASARAFYAKLGARDWNTRLLEMDGVALQELAGPEQPLARHG